MANFSRNITVICPCNHGINEISIVERRDFVKINDYDPFFVIDDYKIIGLDRVREHFDLIGRRTGVAAAESLIMEFECSDKIRSRHVGKLFYLLPSGIAAIRGNVVILSSIPHQPHFPYHFTQPGKVDGLES